MNDLSEIATITCIPNDVFPGGVFSATQIQPMDIEQSAAEIFESKDSLSERFYEYFLHEFPTMQKYFNETNFKRQGVMLTLALSVIERYYTKRTHFCREYLRELGKSHEARQIPKFEYSHWKKAMLASLKRFHGDNWSESLATQWQGAIDLAISEIIAAYAEDEATANTDI